MEVISPNDKDRSRRRTVAGKTSIVISVTIVAVMVIAGWALVNQSNGQSQSPFLTYPLHVDKYNVQHFSNESYEYTVWVENQNYSSSNSGFIHCMLILDPYKGCAGFSSDQITLNPGERLMFTIWSPPPIASQDINWTSYDCQIIQ
jgi:hypothetical protein